MSEHVGETVGTRRWIVPMHSRSPDEKHRASTPLELLFDLVFVVAVAQAASSLHHGIAANHIVDSILRYFMVFFAIWWAWMNFTWFASAYDNDDILYRLAVFVQLSGALILAAGIPHSFDSLDFTIVTAGYVVMRLAAVAQWLRAAHDDASRRTTAYRYVIGITVVQVGWITLVFAPTEWKLIGFVFMVAAELAVPVWAELATPTLWHPGHITERFGLFTLIVLGESILSASLAIQSALQSGNVIADLARIIVGGLLIVLAMWWLYFDRPEEDIRASMRATFIWAYGHLLIFASAAAVGAGLAVGVDYATHHAAISAGIAGAAVTIPVALYVIGLWAIHELSQVTRPRYGFLLPLVAVLIALSSLTQQAVPIAGFLLVTLLIFKLVSSYKQGTQAST